MTAPALLPSLSFPAGVASASRVVIDPRLRGVVTPELAAFLERSGARVHRVGRAAYAHQGPRRWIVGVWAHHEAPPAWAHRLDDHHRYLIGRAPAVGRDRRELVAWAARRRLLHLADGSPLPWWYGDDGQTAVGFRRGRVIP